MQPFSVFPRNNYFISTPALKNDENLEALVQMPTFKYTNFLLHGINKENKLKITLSESSFGGAS